MEDRPRFQTGPREIRPSGIIGGPRETWPGWNRAPTSHTERARMVTLHLYTGAPELYPNNPSPKFGLYSMRPWAGGLLLPEARRGEEKQRGKNADKTRTKHGQLAISPKVRGK